MKKLAQLKKLFNKDITDTLKKHKIPLIGGLVVCLLACIGIFVTYAFYQVTDVTPIIGGSTGDIADLEVRVMAEERDANGNGLGSYALYPYIPEAGYQYNEAKSYCTNGSVINYNATSYEADITAYGHDVCYLYFDSTANLDLTLNVYAQNIDSDGNGIEGEYTKLETTALPSIGYILNTEMSSCENGSTLSYLADENMFNIEASGKDVCTAYMDAIDVDIQLKILVQAKSGSSVYYEADSIPTNAFYELGSQSACTGSANADALSIVNQKVVIAAASRTSCVAYLDVASGPIIESMNVELNGTTVNITLSNSNIGTSPTTYYYSMNGGESWDSTTSNTYSYSNIGNGTTIFMAYSVDASGKTSAILETNEYIFNGIYDYSNVVQTVTVEKSGYYYLQVWGAQGATKNDTYGIGGKGGYSKGYVYLNEGDVLYIYTGGQGNTTSDGGFNGGGNGGQGNNPGGGGGGGTDIRVNNNSLNARIIVAGGGGGAGGRSNTAAYQSYGGYGGGTIGGTGSGVDNSTSFTTKFSGQGGTQTSGGIRATSTAQSNTHTDGSFGAGGVGGYMTNNNYGSGGGGGGWYGGGGGNSRSGSGGGGSGYVYTESTASSYPSGCLLNSNYYLTSASTHAGNTSFTSPTGTAETGHAGNGYAKITYIGQTLS